MATNNSAAGINIDAALVLIFNGNADSLNNKQLNAVKSILLSQVEKNPDLKEPIDDILEMLGI